MLAIFDGICLVLSAAPQWLVMVLLWVLFFWAAMSLISFIFVH